MSPLDSQSGMIQARPRRALSSRMNGRHARVYGSLREALTDKFQKGEKLWIIPSCNIIKTLTSTRDWQTFKRPPVKKLKQSISERPNGSPKRVSPCLQSSRFADEQMDP